MSNIGKITILTFTAVLALSMTACLRKPDSKAGATPKAVTQEPRNIAVEGVVVDRGFLMDEIRSAGVVEGIREAWIICETEGLIQELHFRLGSNVREGEVLLIIENTLAAQNQESAEGQYQTALLEYEAAKRSKDNGSISDLQFSQTYGRFLSAKTVLSTAKDAYENTFIKAPFAGAIASKGRELGVGNYVARGARVARVVDYSAYQAEVSVGEGQILLVRENAKVKITGNDGLPRTGWVSAVSAGSDDSTGSFTVIVNWRPLKNDRLKSGMSVDVVIEPMGEIDHIIAPATAILIRGGEKFVYVDVDGTAELRRIDTGNQLGERIEVFSGLESGDILI
ncbi:MAG: hypothetical protein B6D68_04145, partial [spirochete symbiont of Stewartia floridana]